jgi:iron(II)-dependent oxidoreductase
MTMRPSPILSAPRGWSRREGRGYTIHLAPSYGEQGRLAFALALARGLDRRPRSLDPRFLYDDEGSEIFERITETPEYYQTRTENALLAEVASAVRHHLGRGGATLVELGSGSSTKTRRLLTAFTAAGPTRYVPIDISPAALEPACAALASAYPALSVEGIAASYEHGLPLVAGTSPLMLTFLGSSIGNFDRAERDRFFDMVSTRLAPADHLLVGIDLVKDPARLEAAYNDVAGWSARFTLNLFARANRELEAGIPLDVLEHVAFYDERLERIEIFARARRAFDVALPLLGRSIRVAAGEMIRTEISCKYRPEIFAADVARFGFSVERIDRDAEGLFGLVLFRRRPHAGRVDPDVERRVELEALLRRVRVRTYEIISPLGDDDLRRQHHPLMGPLAWDLAHIAAFEELWLQKALMSDPPPNHGGEGLDPMFDAILTPRAARGQLDLPGSKELAARLDHVRVASLLGLRRTVMPPTRGSRLESLLGRGAVYRLVAQHEAQHQETMLQAIQLREDVVYAPPFHVPRSPHTGPRPVGEMVLVSAGPFVVGSDDAASTYDNERPARVVELPAFRIDAAPVTNGEFLAFIEDGGYETPELWSEAGRRWLAESHAEGPMHWRIVEGMRVAWSFGAPVLLDHDRPVMHVCFHEAQAFARWRKRRLPTELEWEKAAAWDPERGASRLYPWGDDPPTAAHANLDGGLLEPAPVGTYPLGLSAYGCHQMLGDVWEWTSSAFGPYPGFQAFPYREYSEVFFGDAYRVLRGGSWATAGIVARNTFRNWDYPERRQIFAGFRCAEDA